MELKLSPKTKHLGLHLENWMAKYVFLECVLYSFSSFIAFFKIAFFFSQAYFFILDQYMMVLLLHYLMSSTTIFVCNPVLVNLIGITYT